MAHHWRITALTPWLARQGARRGDFLIDRATEHNRYVILRALPSPGETTGHVLDAIGRGYLEDFGSQEPAATPSSSPLRVVAGSGSRPRSG